MENRTLLTILPGQTSDQRVAVLLVQGEQHGLELQHQSWGEGVGWYVQSTVPLDSEQTAQLRQLLRGSAEPRRRTGAAAGGHLKICRAESA